MSSYGGSFFPWESQLSKLAESIAGLRMGKYSDFKIKCSDGSIIPVHRAIICPRSRVLSATVNGKFQEAMSNEIYLEDDEPDIVNHMVDFLYKTDYDDHRGIEEPLVRSSSFSRSPTPEPLPSEQATEAPKKRSFNYSPECLLTNAKVYIIADKNEIQALKELAKKKYQQIASKCWNHPMFTESARLVYDNTVETDRSLKDVIVATASENIKVLLDRGEFIELLNGHGEIATDILRKKVASYDVMEEAIPTDWGFASTKKGKKGKKGTNFGSQDEQSSEI